MTIGDRGRRPGLVGVMMDSHQVVVDVESGTTYRLEASAATVWRAVGDESPGGPDAHPALRELAPSVIADATRSLLAAGLLVEGPADQSAVAPAPAEEQPVPPPVATHAVATQALEGYVVGGRRVAVIGDAPLRVEMEHLLAAFSRSNACEHVYEVTQTVGAVDIVHNGRLACRVRTADEALDWFNLHLRRSATTELAPLVGLHAAALSRHGHAVTLLGASGSGKSTLAAELVRRGFRYLSDEVTAVDPHTRAVTAVPLPLVLESGSWSLFEDHLRAAGHKPPPRVGSWMIDPATLRRSRAVAAADTTGVDELVLGVCVEFRPGSPIELDPLGRTDTLVALLTNVFELHRGQVLVDALADVARTVPCYELTYGDLDAAADVVERLLAERSEGS